MSVEYSGLDKSHVKNNNYIIIEHLKNRRHKMKVILTIVCVVLVMGILWDDDASKKNTQIETLIDLHCDGAKKLIEKIGHRYKPSDICHCLFAKEIPENTILQIGGAGLYRNKFFVKINNKYYLIDESLIKINDKNISVHLDRLLEFTVKQKKEDENYYVFLRSDLISHNVQGPADYFALYVGSENKLTALELDLLYKEFYRQTEDIVKKIKVSKS